MNIDSIHFEGHSCFKKEWAGFDTIKPINIIIGRNNSGKSHLLDLVEALCSKDKIDSQSWQYRYSGILDEESLRNVFREGKSGDGDLLGGDHWHEHGRHFVDIPITWDVATNGGISNEVFPYDFKLDSPYGERSTNERLGLIREVLQHVTHQFNGHSFRRLLAERDIKTEPQALNLTLKPNGNGATNIVQRFLLTANKEFPGEVIKRELLYALNSIFGNDGQFSEIQVQHHDDENSDGPQGHWEIYLGEEKKGLIPLSKSGSGLKTILLVLLNLLVVPKIENKNKSDFVFAFEELENNLHPALLRRLFQYIEKYAINEKAYIFLTTHSSTALDFFGISENAQIIHVLHDGESARTTTVSAHFDRLGVVSELGAKPSDLLQANGIVWVEGPVEGVRGGIAGPGEYRKIQNYVVNSLTGEIIYEPPPAYDVPIMMAELVDWNQREQEIHPVLVSGIAQFQLVHIHPFLDGNGRTSRLLSTLCLYRAGFEHLCPDVNRRSLQRDIRAMIKQGIIKEKATGPTDPGKRYVLNDG